MPCNKLGAGDRLQPRSNPFGTQSRRTILGVEFPRKNFLDLILSRRRRSPFPRRMANVAQGLQ